MPQIIVAADRGAAFGEGAVTFRETVNVADFESQHFATQLVERIGWAVEDAAQAERLPASRAEIANEPERAALANERETPANDRETRAIERESPTNGQEPLRDERVTVPSPA